MIHVMAEVQAVCDRVEILHAGRIVYSDRVAVTQNIGGATAFEVVFAHPPALAVLHAVEGVDEVDQLSANRFKIVLAQESVHCLVNGSVEGGWDLQELTPQRRSLERIFLEVVAGEQQGTVDAVEGENHALHTT